MGKESTHVQCHLVRWVPKHFSGDTIQAVCDVLEHYHCWLPAKYAVIGESVDIKHEGEGWLVIETFTELPTAEVVERSQDYKKQRKASDI